MDLESALRRPPDLCPQWNDIFVKRTLAFATASPAPRILDCGANVGLASLFFRRAYPHARITAYEADPALFAILQANLGANGASATSTRHHAAVWTSTGSADVSLRGQRLRHDRLVARRGRRPRTTVPSVRLRDICSRGSRSIS